MQGGEFPALLSPSNMNTIQTKTIFLNLLRQIDELILLIFGTNPTGDAGSFRQRVQTLFSMFEHDPHNFVLSPVHLGYLAALLKEYEAFRMPPVEKIGTPEILIGVTNWGDIYDKPTTFPPTAHAHAKADILDFPATMTPTAHAHQWGDISAKPTTFPPASHAHSEYALTEHTHEATGGGAADWNTLANRPQTLLDISNALVRKRDPETATSWPDHPLEMGFPLPEGGTDWLSGAHFPYGARIGNTIKIAPDDSSGYIYLEVNGDSKFFAFDGHVHAPEHLYTGVMLSFENNTWLTERGWKPCDGTTTSRNTWLGWILSERGCPFGNGDGTTTVNVPTLIAPAGMTYYMYGDFE